MKFKFEATYQDGIWYVTSENARGLLATGATIKQALTTAGDLLGDMAFACALAQMRGLNPKPPFVSNDAQ